jgi:hypothetical protein
MLVIRTIARLTACALVILLGSAAAIAQQRTDLGTLSIQVRPPNAEVFIDGERWVGADAAGPLQVQLAPGPHRVELRAPGRRPYSTEITIRAGETTPLNVVLPEGPAQDRRPAPPPPSAPPAPATGGIVRVAPSEDGFVFAPDFKVTDIGDEAGAMIGAYGGYVFGGQLLVGAGGYWQANSTNGLRLAYGGPVVEWRIRRTQTIGFNVHALIGAGELYADHYYYPAYRNVRIDVVGPHGSVHVDTGYPYMNGYGHSDVFFVAEPEAQIVVRFGSSARLQGGIGYRATSRDGLSGVSGSIGLQFGR